MIIDIVVHGERLQPLLRIRTGALLLPRDAGFQVGFEIHPDKSTTIDVQMNRKETIILFVKIFTVLKAGRLGQIPAQTI